MEGVTVLLAEDDEQVRNYIQEFLESKGFTVLCAGDGFEALDMAKEADGVDLLLTDLVMPGMDGKALSKKVSEIFPEAKVLYISGYIQDTDLGRSVKEGGKNFLEKPFAPLILMERIKEVLD